MSDQLGTYKLSDEVGRAYPYPLAASYARAYFSANNLSEQHEYLVDLCELIVKYLAAIAVSQYVVDGMRDPTIDLDLFHLRRPNLGHWQGWLHDILALYRKQGHPLLVPELGSFYLQKDSGALLQAHENLVNLPPLAQQTQNSPSVTPQQFLQTLVTYRRRVRDVVERSLCDRECAAKILGPALQTLMQRLDFLAKYRLVHVNQVTVAFKSQSLHYSHHVTFLVGDTPQVAGPQVADVATADQKLYLLDRTADFRPLLSLDPLLRYAHCTSCGRVQPFVLNACDGAQSDYLGYPCTHRLRPDQSLTLLPSAPSLPTDRNMAIDPLPMLYERGIRGVQSEKRQEATELFGEIVATREDFHDAGQKLKEARDDLAVTQAAVEEQRVRSEEAGRNGRSTGTSNRAIAASTTTGAPWTRRAWGAIKERTVSLAAGGVGMALLVALARPFLSSPPLTPASPTRVAPSAGLPAPVSFLPPTTTHSASPSPQLPPLTTLAARGPRETRGVTPTIQPTQLPQIAPTPLMSQTEGVLFVPALPDPGNPVISGSCGASSLFSRRMDAWKCGAGNWIYDLCFTVYNKSSDVACVIDVRGHLRYLRIQSVPDPAPGAYPAALDALMAIDGYWAFQLMDGTMCMVVLARSMPFLPNEDLIPFQCSDGGYLLGEPTKGPTWMVREVWLDSSRKVIQRSLQLPVKRVLY